MYLVYGLVALGITALIVIMIVRNEDGTPPGSWGDH